MKTPIFSRRAPFDDAGVAAYSSPSSAQVQGVQALRRCLTRRRLSEVQSAVKAGVFPSLGRGAAPRPRGAPSAQQSAASSRDVLQAFVRRAILLQLLAAQPASRPRRAALPGWGAWIQRKAHARREQPLKHDMAPDFTWAQEERCSAPSGYPWGISQR